MPALASTRSRSSTETVAPPRQHRPSHCLTEASARNSLRVTRGWMWVKLSPRFAEKMAYSRDSRVDFMAGDYTIEMGYPCATFRGGTDVHEAFPRRRGSAGCGPARRHAGSG